MIVHLIKYVPENKSGLSVVVPLRLFIAFFGEVLFYDVIVCHSVPIRYIRRVFLGIIDINLYQASHFSIFVLEDTNNTNSYSPIKTGHL